MIWFHDVRHELNRSRQIKAFHTEGALRELLERDTDAATDKAPADAARPPAAAAVPARGQQGRRASHRRAQAQPAGRHGHRHRQDLHDRQPDRPPTKAGVAKRVLFLVDRRTLAAQAVRAFNSFDAEPAPPSACAAAPQRLPGERVPGPALVQAGPSLFSPRAVAERHPAKQNPARRLKLWCGLASPAR